VCLETARLLAARPDRRHAVMILLTDAEENGLMGAAALVTDPEVRSRLRAYVNVEATGSDAPAVLFETGPGNGWMVRAFAGAAPLPRGGSYGYEVYKRLPNDTDFSILKTLGVPGLNVGAVGDSYAYHTARDEPERLTDALLEQGGENVLATMSALDARDLSARTDEQAVFFDIASRRMVVLSPAAATVLALGALLAGLAGWIRVVIAARRACGLAGLLRTVAWAIGGTVVVAAAVVGAAALLRAVREVYHPWYAHPDRFWLLLVVSAAAAARLVTSIARRLPPGWRGARHPAAAWTVILPAWLALAATMHWLAPGASYLWTLPLAAAGLATLVAAPATGPTALVAATLVLGVSAGLWGPELREMLRFAVPLLGRMPLVTPVAVLPAALLGGLAMVAPPVAVILATRSPRLTSLPRALATPLLVLALTLSFAWCYVAEAYTRERPLWRYAQYVADYASGRAAWEVAGNEPGLDVHLGRDAPAGWHAASGPLLPGVPAAGFPFPFAFRALARPGPPPLAVHGTTSTSAGELRVEIRVTPTDAGSTVVFALPPGLVPKRASLPGRLRDGWWTAAYGAVPAGTIVFTAGFDAAAADRLDGVRAGLLTPALPGGTGWLGQPAWLGTERSVWYSKALHLAPVPWVAADGALR
jgi:hypothetical protein